MKLKRLVSAIVAVGMMVAMLPVSAVTAFAADIGDTFEYEYEGQKLNYKITSVEDKTAEVSSGSRLTGTVKIPEQVQDSSGNNYIVTAVGDSALAYTPGNLNAYTKVELPETVISIGERAFYSCTSLEDINFPKGLTSIGFAAFAGCKIKSVTIPGGVSSIGNNAFANCKELTDITFDYGVTSIGDQVFYGCEKLANVTLPNSMKSIGKEAFVKCTSLSQIELPKSLTTLEEYAFSQTGLIHVTVPGSIETFKIHVFYNCKKLETAILEEGITILPNRTFLQCDNLKSVTLPNTLKSIGYVSFKDCPSLKTITIPSSVETIWNNAFDGTTKLDAVYFEGTKEQWESRINADSSTGIEGAYNIRGNNCLFTATNPTSEHYYSHTVTINDGTTVEKVIIPYNETLTKPTDPVAKNGYRFAGWYTDDTFTKEFDFTTPITEDATVIAKFEAIPDHELTVKVGTFTYDDNAASGKGNVYEGALVTVTFDENNQLWKDSGLNFDHWDIQSKAKLLDENGEEIVNPGKTFTFVMPKEGVTIEAMPKDATIEEEEEPNVLGTAAVIGTAAVGTAVLAYQGYQLGTEFYLICALPAGTTIPANRGELAELVWNDARKPEPTAVLNADATETDKAIVWAVENDLLKAAKDNGESYEATDPVSRMEVIKVWNQAQELK